MIAQGERSVAGDDRASEKATKEGMKKFFVSLFEKNRLPTNGKICSKFGRPIHMDKLTTQRERVTFARCLDKVDMAKELVHSVQLHTPEGVEHEQTIYYENLPVPIAE